MNQGAFPKTSHYLATLLLAALVAIGGSAGAAPLTPAESEALMRKSGCFKCHTVDRKKEGPAYKDVAARNRGKPDIEKKFYDRLRKGARIKIDGREEEHEPIKTRDPDEIRSVVAWILSR